MAQKAIRREELFGLALALGVHVGLVALLVLHPPRATAPPVPERIKVTISTEIGLTSTSPEPEARAAPDVARQIGEPAPKAENVEPEAALPKPAPPKPAPPKPAPPKVEPVKPQAKAAPPKPAPPRPVTRPVPVPRAAASPRPVAKPFPRPAASAAPARAPAKPATSAARPAAAPAASTAPRQPARAGASRVGDDFLKGISGAQTPGTSRNPPAATIGPAVRSSLASSISRQLKPHWAAPQGADAELLVTVLAFDLNRDGSLVGRPRVVSQAGVTDANRAQQARHAEQAIRAVQLAAPYDLPEEYYDAWKRVSSFRFDRRLSQ